MLRHYFKTAWRQLWKNKTFSVIHILGLSVGIAAALLMISHVKDELSYDKGYKNADRIFRITQEGMGDDKRHWAATSPILGTSMEQYFPEIESITRLHKPYPYQVFSYVSGKGELKKFEERTGFFADATAIKLFDLAFKAGDSRTALNGNDGIILSESMAVKYFGDEDPIGKILQDEMRKSPLKVTGVVRDLPFNSHFHFDYLIAMGGIDHYLNKQMMENRTWNGFYNYVLLKNSQQKKQIESKLPDFTVNFYEAVGETRAGILSSRKLHLQPITDIHLHSNLEKEMSANSDITYVIIFSLTALFILLVAAVNFINISTAQAFNRMKEIGLRKVIGAGKQQLIRQFLGESFVITLLSASLALILFKAAIPFYNDLTAKEFQFGQVLSWSNAALLLALITFIGLLAGIYPAWFVANFNPISSLKRKRNSNSSVTLVRKSLIVFQFVVSVFMIFSTIIIYRQTQLFQKKSLGFDKQQVIALTMYDEMWQQYPALLDAIGKNSVFLNTATLSTLPGERFSMNSFSQLSSATGTEMPSIRTMWADEKLLATLNIPLKEGRNFVSQFPKINHPEFLLNETAVKSLSLDNPIGKEFIVDRDTGRVVGVVKDFNFASLHSKVEPLAIEYNPYKATYLLVKVRPNQLSNAVDFLKTNVKQLSPSSVFSYTFLDEKLDRLYQSEMRMTSIFKVFAGFALFISCLGLFGLALYAAQLRFKEIGIRKVLGASVPSVVALLSKDFLKLILTGTLIAWPLAWLAMSNWLGQFAYRVNISPWIFIVSGLLAGLAGLLTIGSQGIKAALINPVKSLKAD